VSRVAGVLEDESAKVLGPKGGEVQVREQEVGQGDEARGWCRGIPNLTRYEAGERMVRQKERRDAHL